ncbi:DNA gyrase subunit B [Pyxidicoccus parkwayensis]|uniref:DNA topoisomerase (ATP-hydrolyzing) n=1 Tax=Pyxidicoccus parkwayensis TaxID=2813578 RepID=A0ABX7NXD3_9BACT|nr:DNA gyrase subunit B [Pyxidicoccus parkwaysis]QSQ23547.1 DNA gyrase subunit B [Pyxidicoccus parkwaysis]
MAESYTYTADDIVELDFLQGVRKRPGMYVGSTDANGLHHLVCSMLEGVYSDARRGACRDFTLEVGAEGTISIFSTGRFAPPVELAEMVQGRGLQYREPLGPEWSRDSMLRDVGWGVSLPIALGLSSRYDVDTWDGARQWRLSGIEGRPVGKPREVQPAEPLPIVAEKGVRIRLVLDATLFETTAVDAKVLSRRCREMAFLAPGLRACFTDHRTGESTRLHYAGGISERLLELIADVPRLHPEPLTFEAEWEDTRVRCALQWCEGEECRVWSYDNTVRMDRHRRRAHVNALFMALREALSDLSGKPAALISRPRLARGLQAVIAADGADVDRLPLARQTMERLATDGLRNEVRDQLRPRVVEALRGHALMPWLVDHARARPRPAVVSRRRRRD